MIERFCLHDQVDSLFFEKIKKHKGWGGGVLEGA